MITQKLDILIEILQEVRRLMEQLADRRTVSQSTSEPFLPINQQASPSRVLDNADIKQMLKIGDTKLYYLKKKKILKPYKLDGKDVYLEHEVIEAIRGSGGF
ncbi:hypothetical protein [Olivibacter sp. XZL3]|uniref:hypothetical protein n=1 Tax=Olivibacter sp. XZL3 TaxID=1735116 RepID=UPI001066EC4F|nr:hypothetical protein [Olivibacter sp. XZL3]